MNESKDIQKEIEALNQQRADLEMEISQSTATINQLTTEITTQTALRDGLSAETISLTATRNNLNNEIAAHTATRDTLNSEITTLTNSKNELETLVAGTTSSKQTLETDISQRNATITQLNAEISNRTVARDNLNAEISVLTKNQTEISNSIATNTPVKQALEKDVSGLTANKKSLEEEIGKLRTDKQKWEENVKQWRDKFDLFSNDIAGISENNLSQRNKYAIGIVLTSIAALIFMIILVYNAKNGSEVPDGIKNILKGNPRLIFLVYVLMRISIVGSLFVLIFVFINLLRGFVSQYIRTQEKMSSIRLMDFLASKIGKEAKILTEAEKIPFETAKMEKQNILLSKHLPGLMENNPSSFEKLSKTKSPEEILQDLLKSGKITVQK